MAERRNKTMRDMAISMGLIVVAVVAVAWLYNGMSVSPGHATDQGPAPSTDVSVELARVNRVVGFTPLQPAVLPADWRPQSFTYALAADAPAKAATVRAGWLTPDGRFISLIQAQTTPEALLSGEYGTSGPATGTVSAGGADWTVTTGARTEAAWYREVGGLVVVITGSAAEADFRILADALTG